jgi:hypothetical protein
LPPGLSCRPFGVRLTAVVALLSGRYRLSRREVGQLLHDLWHAQVSLGAVVRQEQAQSESPRDVPIDCQGAPGRRDQHAECGTPREQCTA